MGQEGRTRRGKAVDGGSGDKGEFGPWVQTVGSPLEAGEKDVAWP